VVHMKGDTMTNKEKLANVLALVDEAYAAFQQISEIMDDIPAVWWQHALYDLHQEAQKAGERVLIFRGAIVRYQHRKARRVDAGSSA
jgi:hypothetical protein